MTTLILKPHLIPLIPAKFSAQSGKNWFKSHHLHRVQLSWFSAVFKAQPQRPWNRGRSFWDGSGAVAEQDSGDSTDVSTPFIYHLQNTEYIGSSDEERSFRSFPPFGELGLITSLKDSSWRLESLYLENLLEFLCSTLFNLNTTREKLQRPWMGKVTPPTPFIPKKGCQSISKLMKQIRTEKISMRFGRPCLGWG